MKRFFLISFSVLFAALITGALFLKKGIHVNELSVEGVSLNNISLQWKTKLDLEIETLDFDIQQENNPAKELPDISFPSETASLLSWVDRLFSRISIQNVNIGEIEGTLLYESALTNITLSSRLVSLNATVKKDNHILIADIQNLRSEQFNSQATGSVQFDLKSNKGSGTFELNLAGSLPVSLSINMDHKQLSFAGKEAGKITDITPFVDLFEIDQAIQKWITDYLAGTRYNLKSFSGYFPWKDPMVITESFVAEARVDDCQYTFVPGFEAVKSDYTDLFFKKGVLTILPHETRFYGQDGQDSWLDINFNDPDNIILTAYILTLAPANQVVVDLLAYYDIPLPFLQTEGETSVDLILSINLNTELVQADGTFLIDEGKVAFYDENFAVKDLRFTLDTDQIAIEQLQVSFDKLFLADVTGDFDAITENGSFDIVLQESEIDFGGSKLILDESKAKPTLNYSITSETSTVIAGASSWTLGGFPLSIGPFNTPLDLDDLSGVITSTPISCYPFVTSEAYGMFSLKEQSLDFQGSLSQCQIKDLKLQKSVGDVSVKYDDGFTIQTSEKSQWILGTVPVTLYPSEFKISDSLMSVTMGRMSFGGFFDATFSGYFDNLTQCGEFVLKDLDIKDDTMGHLLTPETTVSIKVSRNKETLSITIPELEASFRISEKDKTWSLQLDDLGVLYAHSPLLQQYLLNNGNLKVEGTEDGRYHFSAYIPYEYPLLVKDGVPQNDYQIEGEFYEKSLLATVNKDLEIVYKDDIKISSSKLSFNVTAIMQLLKDLPDAVEFNSENKLKMDVLLTAEDTSLFFKADRQILADSFTLQYSDGISDLELQHGSGSISLGVEGEYFSLTGKELNDKFMNSLLSGMDSQTGSMGFAAKGTFDEFTAMVKIENTIMKDFKTLNNVLAMVNTIPALVTFNLPSYSTEGLSVKSLVAGMKVKKGVATFETLALDSSEMRMAGNGWIDFLKETVEMDLNLITRAKENVNKIPLVGYILVGKKKSPSITVQISGDLLDPKVEHSTFEEVVTVPFHMLFRTLALPVYLVSPIFDLAKEEAREKETEEDWELPISDGI